MTIDFDNEETFLKHLNDVVYPTRAISDVAHLKGRTKEAEALRTTLFTPGRQPFIFGLRGAGKTSLALCIDRQFSKMESSVLVTCAPQMTFADVVRTLCVKALDIDPMETERRTEGKIDGGVDLKVWRAGGSMLESRSFKGIPLPRDPNEALALLNKVRLIKGGRFAFIVDEFDQLTDQDSHLQLGLLAKLIADGGSDIKFMFCGVAETVQSIFKAHPSTLRLFEPIEVSRIGLQACFDIMDDVEKALSVEIEKETKYRIAQISDGFPYFVHLIIEKIIMQWFRDKARAIQSTSALHYERGLLDAATSASVELRGPYEQAAKKYALDGELLIWALASGDLFDKQIKIVARDFAEIYSSLTVKQRPSKQLNQNQISARLTHLMSEPYGKMIKRPLRSYYSFSEKRMRGYARLRAETQGVHLRPDHPLLRSTGRT